jgi:acyl-CoA thioesterase II
VFGGQVLGQALQGRLRHGRAGPHRAFAARLFSQARRFQRADRLFVDRSRDGASFTSRRVIAIQHGEQIFNMAASFQVPQPGVEHQMTNAGRAAARTAKGRPGAEEMPSHLPETARRLLCQ